MKVLALITTARCADLTALCVESLKTYAPTVQRVILVNECDRELGNYLDASQEFHILNWKAQGHGGDHASAIEMFQEGPYLEGFKADVVVLVDNDCVILSKRWYEELTRAFEDPVVGAWGAQWITDPTLLHASMLAMRTTDFRSVTTFRPCGTRDTGGHACAEIRSMGFRLVGYEREPIGFDRDGWATYHSEAPPHELLWAHLGSGTFAIRPSWLRRAWRFIKSECGDRMAEKAILRERRRATFIERHRSMLSPVNEWLRRPPDYDAKASDRASRLRHGRPHDAKMAEDHE